MTAECQTLPRGLIGRPLTGGIARDVLNIKPPRGEVLRFAGVNNNETLRTSYSVAGCLVFVSPQIKISGDVDHWAQSNAAEMHNLLAVSRSAPAQSAIQARVWTDPFRAAAAFSGYLRKCALAL